MAIFFLTYSGISKYIHRYVIEVGITTSKILKRSAFDKKETRIKENSTQLQRFFAAHYICK